MFCVLNLIKSLSSYTGHCYNFGGHHGQREIIKNNIITTNLFSLSSKKKFSLLSADGEYAIWLIFL